MVPSSWDKRVCLPDVKNTASQFQANVIRPVSISKTKARYARPWQKQMTLILNGHLNFQVIKRPTPGSPYERGIDQTHPNQTPPWPSPPVQREGAAVASPWVSEQTELPLTFQRQKHSGEKMQKGCFS